MHATYRVCFPGKESFLMHCREFRESREYDATEKGIVSRLSPGETATLSDGVTVEREA